MSIRVDLIIATCTRASVRQPLSDESRIIISLFAATCPRVHACTNTRTGWLAVSCICVPRACTSRNYQTTQEAINIYEHSVTAAVAVEAATVALHAKSVRKARIHNPLCRGLVTSPDSVMPLSDVGRWAVRPSRYQRYERVTQCRQVRSYAMHSIAGCSSRAVPYTRATRM